MMSPGRAAPKRSVTVSGGQGHRTEYVPFNHNTEAIHEQWTRTGWRPEVHRQHLAGLLAGIGPQATRAALYKVAKRLSVKGRSTMTRRQLVEAIERLAGGALGQTRPR